MFDTRGTALTTATTEEALLDFLAAADYDPSLVASLLLSDDICPAVFAALTAAYVGAALEGTSFPAR